jgi:hypothetical protein
VGFSDCKYCPKFTQNKKELKKLKLSEKRSILLLVVDFELNFDAVFSILRFVFKPLKRI